MRYVLNVVLSLLISTQTAFAVVSQADQTKATLEAANRASASLMGATNAFAHGYLLIFALVAFLMGIAAFLPGIRRPGFGVSLVIMSMVIVSSPSCINMVT